MAQPISSRERHREHGTRAKRENERLFVPFPFCTRVPFLLSPFRSISWLAVPQFAPQAACDWRRAQRWKMRPSVPLRSTLFWCPLLFGIYTTITRYSTEHFGCWGFNINVFYATTHQREIEKRGSWFDVRNGCSSANKESIMMAGYTYRHH